jgi:hypothetical protein
MSVGDAVARASSARRRRRKDPASHARATGQSFAYAQLPPAGAADGPACADATRARLPSERLANPLGGQRQLPSGRR